MTTGVTTYGQLQRMTHEQRREHCAASVVEDPEHDEDPRVRALFEQARRRAEQRLAARPAPGDGD